MTTETKPAPRYFYEVWVSPEEMDTEHFPATVWGFVSAFERADELSEETEVAVYVHRWDYAETGPTSRGERADEGFASVEWSDDDCPMWLRDTLIDDDGRYLARVPKEILAAFEKAKRSWISLTKAKERFIAGD